MNGMQFYAPGSCDTAWCIANDTGIWTLAVTPGSGVYISTPLTGISVHPVEPVDLVFSAALFALNAGLCLVF